MKLLPPTDDDKISWQSETDEVWHEHAVQSFAKNMYNNKYRYHESGWAAFQRKYMQMYKLCEHWKYEAAKIVFKKIS